MNAADSGPAAVSALAPRRTGPIAMAAAWGPVLGWLAVIFSLSSDQFSDVNTAAWLSAMPLVGAFGAIDTANLIVRKSAHFVEYALLGMLMLRALRMTWARRDRWLVVGAVVACAACASLDELRQAAFTTARSGTARDVLLDSVGALAGAVAGATFIYRRLRGARA